MLFVLTLALTLPGFGPGGLSLKAVFENPRDCATAKRTIMAFKALSHPYDLKIEENCVVINKRQ